LAIVYGIIKMHRGQIHIQSEVGKGTLVTIQLPIRLPNLNHPSAPLQKPKEGPDLIG
jgi:signal transduction histidine kinase